MLICLFFRSNGSQPIQAKICTVLNRKDTFHFKSIAPVLVNSFKQLDIDNGFQRSNRQECIGKRINYVKVDVDGTELVWLYLDSVDSDHRQVLNVHSVGKKTNTNINKLNTFIQKKDNSLFMDTRVVRKVVVRHSQLIV